MSTRPLSSFSSEHQRNLKFGEATFEILSDFLTNINNKNRLNLESLSANCGHFKKKELVEYIFLLCKEFKLDPLVGYHAVEILERFMIKHIEDLLSVPTAQGASAGGGDENMEELVFQSIRPKFSLIILSCVQLASKLSLHCKIVDNNIAMRFLQSAGYSITKDTLMSSELVVLKTLNFNLSATNPLTYVETLLEVLSHNECSMALEDMHHVCKAVLQFTFLQRTSIYQALLTVVTRGTVRPQEHREKFVAVTEDCMLLGVGVVAAAAFILDFSTWEQVVQELSLITGISIQSTMEFAYVILMHVTNNSDTLV
ncbi:cyclin N-terminal domain-containing protein 1 isoform X2 [Sardina pilchardus]|uniref:cyclin N-terminal domain-containing protein 1 isoform X2 n=1 Tax=Sardina pilchardus TaxID=27697 RepID=UPI002E15809A